MKTPRIVAVALVAVLIPGCLRPSGWDVGAPGAPAPINDELLLRRLEANAARLCEAGQARSVSELAAELARADGPPAVRRPAAADRPLSLAALYHRRSRGVLVITRMYKCERCPNWHHSGEGSGFVLSEDGVCVACRHTFERAEPGCMVAAGYDGTVYPITAILASSASDDIALFRVDGRELSPVPLRSGAPVGTEVCVISHPRHHHFLLTQGIIARRAEKFGGIRGGQEEFRKVPTPLLNITADFGSGSSGAPVLDRCGNAVGMVVLTTGVHADAKQESEPQMTLKTCIPAERILTLLQGANRAEN